MSTLAGGEAPFIAAAEVPQKPFVPAEKGAAVDTDVHSDELDGAITEEDLNTLRRVSGKINWTAYTIAFVELCE